MKVFKYSKGWSIVIVIFSLLLIGFFIGGIVVAFSPDIPVGLKVIIILMGLFFAIFSVAAIYDVWKGKFVIEDEGVYVHNLFYTRTLHKSEIKGFRTINQYIFIESNSSDKKKIQISQYLENSWEIIDWLLANNFRDLEEVEADKEKADFWHNSVFGATLEERKKTLKRGKRIAMILNWCGGIIAIWTFFNPKPYNYAILASIIFPVLPFMTSIFSNGLIRMGEQREEGVYPSVLSAIFFPVLAVGLRALIDFEIYDYSNVWLLFFIILAVLSLIIFFSSQELEFKKSADYFIAFGIVMLLGCYVYGSLISLNCCFDDSTPQEFSTDILDKRISSSKTTTYYLELSPWGNRTEADEISVSESFYNATEVGETIDIYVKSGWFNIPWLIPKKQY